MTTQKLYPNGIETTSEAVTVFGGGTADEALADVSDSRYVRLVDLVAMTLDNFTIPAGVLMKSYQLFARGRSPFSNNGVVFGFWEATGGWDNATEREASRIVDRPISSSWEDFTSPVRPYAFSQTNLNNAEVELRSNYDAFDAAKYSEFSHCYLAVTYVVAPSVTVTAVTPDPYTPSTTVPIAWTNTLDSDGGAQTHYEMRVFTDAQYLAGGFDPATSPAFYETGQVVSSSTSASTGPLFNSDTYRAYVRTAQTVNGAKHWSSYASDEFTLDVSTSDVDTVVGTPVDADGKITVTVSRDAGSQGWELVEVERTVDGGTTWAPVRTADLVDATGDADTFVVDDFEVPNGQDVAYRARPTYYSSGLPITGDWVESASVSWSSDDSWLKAPLDPSLNIAICPSGFSSTSRRNGSGQFDILGARDAVVVSDVLSSPSSGSVTYRTVGKAEALALDGILDGCGGVLLLDLGADSVVGPNRDGFTYVAIRSTSEQWGEQFYRGGGSGRRFTTIDYTTVSAPPDATAGVL